VGYTLPEGKGPADPCSRKLQLKKWPREDRRRRASRATARAGAAAGTATHYVNIVVAHLLRYTGLARTNERDHPLPLPREI